MNSAISNHSAPAFFDGFKSTFKSTVIDGVIARMGSGSTSDLSETLMKRNLYGFELNKPGNVVFLLVFLGITIFNVVIAFRSKQIWYNVCFTIGFGLETLGYVGRVSGFASSSSMGSYILQSFCLTIAPAFIMAGIYFLFAQIVTLHGRQYSLFRPTWYTKFFITVDVISIFVQAQGGGLSAMSSRGGAIVKWGKIIMFVGILVQIVAMTVFLILWFIFLGKIYFQDRHNIPPPCEYKTKNIGNYMKLLLNVESAKSHKTLQLERFYNPDFQHFRSGNLFTYFPLAISLAVLIVYVRCVYRVVELKEGYGGYLMSHEIFLFVLDSALIAIAGLIFVPFHPSFVFGRYNVLTSKEIKKIQKGALPQSFDMKDQRPPLEEMDYLVAAQKRAQATQRTQL